MKKIALLTILCSTAFGCASPPQLTNEDAMAIRQGRLEQGATSTDQLQLTQQQIALQRQSNAQAQAQAAAYWQQYQSQQSQQPTPMPRVDLNLYTPQVQPIAPPRGNITCIRSGVLTSCEASTPQAPPVSPPNPSTITCIASGPVTNCRY